MIISVIVPIYNIEKYLCKCLNSLVSQNCKSMEIILVDDGSVDTCPAICDSYQEKDSRIRVIHKQNKGLVSARRAGLLEAHGEHIMFVDGDDWIEDHSIDRLVNIISENGDADLICFGSKTVTNTSVIMVSPPLKAGEYSKQEIVDRIFPSLIEDSYGNHFDSSIWDKVYKKDQLIKCYDNMPDEITMGEDGAITRQYILRCNKMVVIDECLYFYNKTNQMSMTQMLKPISWNNTWLIRGVLINSFGLEGQWTQQINRNTAHNLFITAISQLNGSGSLKQRLKQIRDELKKDEIKRICNNTGYASRTHRLATFAVAHSLSIILYFYWRFSK